jgi:glycosyltransferase involved in cell wall biosynthesis
MGFLDLVLNRSINPLIGTFHHPPDQLDQIIHFKSRLHGLSAMILMSETQRPWFLEQGVPDHKIHVILHGVDTQFFHPPERPHAPFSETRLLAVGSTGRDFPLLAKTASHFQGRKDIRFEILGPLEQRSLFDSLKNVTYRTGVPDAALLTSYQDATCLLHLTTAATANNVLVEALACGLPVIASRVGGVPEYLTPGCGWLVEPACIDSCIGAIESCLSDPASLGEMRKRARARADSLSWSRIADQTTVLYQSLV